MGQILETHMGWAARGLGLKIDEALDDYRRGRSDPGADAMKIAYGEEAWEGISSMPEALVEAATNVTHGAHRHARLRRREGADVNDALARAGFDTSGQSTF